MESGDGAATGAEGGWLEESLLDCAFAACDVEQTGVVPAWRIVEYLQAVMGRSGEEQQLQELRQMLELTAAGVALDLPTFRAVMREWIAHCQQDGAHQALEHGWASSQKLEDLEDEVRQLQEEKRGLIEQNQRLEREQHGLLEEVTGLQEMNSALLAEAKGRKENLQAPEAQKDAILQELQTEISSLHRLLRQTLEALATKCQEGGRGGTAVSPPPQSPCSPQPSQCVDQKCRRKWWLLPHLLLVLLLALLCLLPHITPWLELSYLRSPTL
ncbi:uncharacterized protein [Anas platyrhynchos]|uniref:uncharacterized protein n=1 Tax=Anas platyrhynchos TaxID=8839 RepID=UPI003AF308D2